MIVVRIQRDVYGIRHRIVLYWPVRTWRYVFWGEIKLKQETVVIIFPMRLHGVR